MKEQVLFITAEKTSTDESLCSQLRNLLLSRDYCTFIEPHDMVAVKTHFGESDDLGYVRPLFLKMIGELIKERKGSPFLTETSTLYKGNRSDAVIHLEHAHRQGFGFNETGMPIIIADGLFGDEEIEVAIKGKLYKKVKLASAMVKAQGMVVVSHFTGHLGTGFGAAMKNMGMGCSSRKGKMTQHSTSKPKIKLKACVKCGECVRWCPVEAITMTPDGAVINSKTCIGCGQCLATCRFDAVAYNWGATYEELQKKIVEHALGLAGTKRGKSIYINFLTRISKDCDCMTGFKQIAPDIGILIAKDPVAIDAASLNLVEEKTGMPFSSLAYNIPYRIQIEYAEELGLGTTDFDLVNA